LKEEINYEELASRCELRVEDLRRFLRLAMANHVFQEPRSNVVAHSAMSRILVDLPALHDWIGLVCEDMLTASVYCIDAMRKWPGSCAPAHTGFALSRGTENDFFDELGRDPLRASRFAAGMKFNNSASALDPAFVVNNVPGIKDSPPVILVDIGGSHGSTAIELLKRFPHIRECVVQDLPEVIAGAGVPSEVDGRLKFQEYDFFREQSTKGADVYFLRMVLHDWPDDKAIAILESQVPAMAPQSRLILNEICLPDPGVLTCYQEQFLR